MKDSCLDSEPFVTGSFMVFGKVSLCLGYFVLDNCCHCGSLDSIILPGTWHRLFRHF